MSDIELELKTATITAEIKSNLTVDANIDPYAATKELAAMAEESAIKAKLSETNAAESELAAQAAKESIEASAALITTNQENIEELKENQDLYLNKKYTVKIEIGNSNPSTALTYADAAETMEAGSSDLDSIIGAKPCLVKVEDGRTFVNYYLDPNDFSKKVDGTAADITSGADGNVMIEFPRRGLNITRANGFITISLTTAQNNPNFKYLAHSYGDKKANKIFIGAYLGSLNESNNLQSLSEKVVANNKTIGESRSYGQSNGNGFEQLSAFALFYLQALFYLKYKTLNSQSAVGVGYGNGKSAGISTGGSEAYGMDMENCVGTEKTDWGHHVKCFGIEDLWMNYNQWIDGLVTDSEFNILTTTSGFNDTGTDYEFKNASGFTANASGYISDAQGTSETGFVAKEFSGSSSTYYSDFGYFYSSRVAFCGGHYGNGSNGGGDHLVLYYSPTGRSSYVAPRLMLYGLEDFKV